MKKLLLVRTFLILSVIILLSACGINSKDSYLESFEEFVVKVEKSENFSEEDLTSIKKEYLDYTETYYNKYKEELTSTEKELIVKLKARYYAVMAKQELKDVGSALKDLGEQANDLINNMNQVFPNRVNIKIDSLDKPLEV